MKRVTSLPQLVLGMAFSWAIPMAYGAVTEQLSLTCWMLFIANLLWTIAYDTMYAMVDRDDDLKIGVKSTAILFGQNDKRYITLTAGYAHTAVTGRLGRTSQRGLLSCSAVSSAILSLSAVAYPGSAA